MHLWPRQDYRPSSYHRKLKKYYWKCHNHRRCGRRIPVYRYVIGRSKLPTKSPTDCVNTKGWGIKCISDRVRTTVHRHITESWKNITGNATITDDVADGFQSVGMLSVGQNYRQNHWRTVRIPKGRALNASLTASICWQNYWLPAKNMEGN